MPDPSMPKTVAIRHVPFEDLDSFAEILEGRGFSISYREAPVDDLTTIEIEAADLLIVLGGPIGVYEDDVYPFLADEIRLVEERLARGRPVLGICLGAQIMARALGAPVYATGAKEIGWAPLALSQAGQASCLRPLGPQISVLHWHGDTFDLPAGARHLAATEVTANQAFAWASHGLALQFHLEATARGLERWYVGHATEIGATPGLSVAGLRRQAAQSSPRLLGPARACLEDWLDGLTG